MKNQRQLLYRDARRDIINEVLFNFAHAFDFFIAIDEIGALGRMKLAYLPQ